MFYFIFFPEHNLSLSRQFKALLFVFYLYYYFCSLVGSFIGGLTSHNLSSLFLLWVGGRDASSAIFVVFQQL